MLEVCLFSHKRFYMHDLVCIFMLAYLFNIFLHMFANQLSSLHDFVFLFSVLLLICVSFFFLLNGCDTKASNWKLRYVSESLSFCLQNHLWWISWLFAVAICLQVFAIASKFDAKNLRNIYGHYTAYVILLWHICFSICAVVEFREDGTAKSNLDWWMYKNINEEQMHYFSTSCLLFDLFFLHLIFFNMSLAGFSKCSYKSVQENIDYVETAGHVAEQSTVSMPATATETPTETQVMSEDAKISAWKRDTDSQQIPKPYFLSLLRYRELDFIYFCLLVIFAIFFLLQLADLARITEWLIVLVLFLLQFFAYVRLRMLKTCAHQKDSGLISFRIFVALAFFFYVAFTIISTMLIAPLHLDFMLDTNTNLSVKNPTMKTGGEFAMMITVITLYISFIAFIF